MNCDDLAFVSAPEEGVVFDVFQELIGVIGVFSDYEHERLYDGAEHVNYYWNTFDQVLLRPELAERFDSNSLTIVKSVGPMSLVRADGRPDSASGSDHLPLLFEVEF